MEGNEKVVITSCSHDCGGSCILLVHVKDGVITRIEADDGEEPQLRACLRGRAYRQRVYAPDRLKFPMKRVGERGEGKFERISWDEALDTVARELKRVKNTYGNAAIMHMWSAGSRSQLHGKWLVQRLLNEFGGATEWWGGASNEGQIFAAMATFGDIYTSNTRDDLPNSRLIILWGWNPADSIWTTNTSYFLAKAREAGARVIAIDPKFTSSGAVFADQWIPIRPGTDAAMLIAMAYVIIKENLQDQRFIDTYTFGFEKYRDYVLGREDSVPKTPAWAEAITGVPASTIEKLAREYATTKPAALFSAYAPGRSAMGEQYHRAAYVLAAMTGNTGKPGACAGGGRSYPSHDRMHAPPAKPNPVDVAAPPRKYAIDSAFGGTSGARVHSSKIFDAILKGKAGGYYADIKLLWATDCNLLNQRPNINKGIQALKSLEFIVVSEQFMTPTARFADILLPINTFMERNDVYKPWGGSPYYFFMNKAIDSLHESRSDVEICRELAPRLGIYDYDSTEKTEEQWLREIVEVCEDLPDYESFKKKGIHWVFQEPHIAFKKEIQDPKNHPFKTPSGKIEIYSNILAEMNNPEIPPIPKYFKGWEGPSDPLREKYPLQLVTSHYKLRAHSTYDNIPWMRELEPQVVWINLEDARARGIKDGGKVRVFNNRGEMVITAKVTERIMPGVVDIPEGAWFDPDENGIDRGGCPSILANDEHSPGGSFASNTALVQVAKL